MFVNLDLFAQFLKEFCMSSNALVADLCIWDPFNSDLQRELGRRLRHTTLNTEQNQLAMETTPSMFSDVN